jgi:hypothetical protein
MVNLAGNQEVERRQQLSAHKGRGNLRDRDNPNAARKRAREAHRPQGNNDSDDHSSGSGTKISGAALLRRIALMM